MHEKAILFGFELKPVFDSSLLSYLLNLLEKIYENGGKKIPKNILPLAFNIFLQDRIAPTYKS